MGPTVYAQRLLVIFIREFEIHMAFHSILFVASAKLDPATKQAQTVSYYSLVDN